MESVRDIVAKFRGKGLKITPQRIAVFRSLENNFHHPSAEDIYRRIRMEHPSISLTTVYKTLETLRDLGEVYEVHVSKERVLYDANSDPHHHMICLKCSRIIDVPDAYIGGLKPPSVGDIKFHVTFVRVEFFGYCGRCKRVVSV